MRIPDKNWLLSEASTKTSPPLSPPHVICTGRNPVFPIQRVAVPSFSRASTAGPTGRCRRRGVPSSTNVPVPAEKTARRRRALVPLFPRKIGPSGCRQRYAGGATCTESALHSIIAPEASSALAVKKVSSALSGLPICAGPSERAAIMSVRWVIDLEPGSRICAFIFETGFIVLRRFFIYGFFQGLSHRLDGRSFKYDASQPPFELSGSLVQQHVQTGDNRAPGVPGGSGKGGPSGAVNYVHYGHLWF